jgi:hypothetical protein
VRLPGTTPSDPDDRGECDPDLAAALLDGDRGRIVTALVNARLLVPVVAVPARAADAEMALPALVRADGRRALPAFSSYEALRAWQSDARPVPMRGSRVVIGAAAEGYHAVVLDVAGPVMHVVEDRDLDRLAALLRDHGVGGRFSA